MTSLSTEIQIVEVLLASMSSNIERLSAATKSNKELANTIVETTKQLEFYIQSADGPLEISSTTCSALVHVMAVTGETKRLLCKSLHRVTVINSSMDELSARADELSISRNNLESSLAGTREIREDIREIQTALNSCHLHQQKIVIKYFHRTAGQLCH